MIKFKVPTVLLSLILAVCSANAAAEFNNIVIFGDSLSDTGNLASALQKFPSPPFYEGSRITDGPVAVEHLAHLLGLSASPSLHLIGQTRGTNFAVAGASARNSNRQPIDLEPQVAAYLLQSGGIADDNNLYIIFIGGNDVRAARDLPYDDSKALLTEATHAIAQQLRLLISVGAKHIMVVNSPDIGHLPETAELATATDNPDLIRKARKRSKKFNRKLAWTVQKVEQDTNTDVILFDLISFTQNLTRNAQAFGYINTTDACFSSLKLEFKPGCELGENFSNYLYFDEVHPTGHTHERLSRALFANVPENESIFNK